MAILHQICPTCSKPVSIQSQFAVGEKDIFVYSCGHLEFKLRITVQCEPQKQEIKDTVHESFLSFDKTKKAYDYQQDGVVFVEKTGLKALIADAMGTGKTIQASIVLKRSKQLVFPTLVVVKPTTTFQWARELHDWALTQDDNGVFSIMAITDRKHILPGFKLYIISMDFLSRKGVKEALNKLNLKAIVIDEVQHFKDPSALRTRALLELISESKIEYRIALSGTPIKNRADEYFTILNLLDPGRFYSRDAFRRTWLIQNEKDQYTRINPVYLNKFHEITSNYIIRREKHEVLTNLPALTRDFQLIEIDDPIIKKSYNSTLDLFRNFLRENGKAVKSNDILGWLAQLRAITGVAKIKFAIEWTEDFLESTDESLAIGIHHHSVRDTLYQAFAARNLNPLKLSGEDSTVRKDRIVNDFNNQKSRLLVINALAGGVGLNLQSCANALVLERQWSSADEEQFESRFHRDGQQHAVTITYPIAVNTIDEFFHQKVYEKRNILGELGIGAVGDSEQSLEFLKEFAETVLSKHL